MMTIHRNNILYTLFLFIAVSFSSCVNEMDIKGEEVKAGKVNMEFQIGVEKLRTIETRAGVITTENEGGLHMTLTTHEPTIETRATGIEQGIKNIWVLQFEKTGMDETDELLAKENVTSMSETTKDGNVIYKLRVDLVESNNCQIFFIANEDAINLSVGSSTVKNYKDLAKTLTNPSITESDYFPMVGNYAGMVPAVSEPDLTIWMTRMAAKITIKLLNNIPSYHTLTFSTIQLISIPKDIRYYDYGRYVDANWTYPIDIAKSFPDNHVTYTPVEFKKEYTWYMAENRRGIKLEIKNQKQKGTLYAYTTSATYIYLDGMYDNGGSKPSPIQVYLFPGENITTDFNICRNTHYIITANFQSIDIDDRRIVRRQV